MTQKWNKMQLYTNTRGLVLNGIYSLIFVLAFSPQFCISSYPKKITVHILEPILFSTGIVMDTDITFRPHGCKNENTMKIRLPMTSNSHTPAFHDMFDFKLILFKNRSFLVENQLTFEDSKIYSLPNPDVASSPCDYKIIYMTFKNVIRLRYDVTTTTTTTTTRTITTTTTKTSTITATTPTSRYSALPFVRADFNSTNTKNTKLFEGNYSILYYIGICTLAIAFMVCIWFCFKTLKKFGEDTRATERFMNTLNTNQNSDRHDHGYISLAQLELRDVPQQPSSPMIDFTASYHPSASMLSNHQNLRLSDQGASPRFSNRVDPPPSYCERSPPTYDERRGSPPPSYNDIHKDNS